MNLNRKNVFKNNTRSIETKMYIVVSLVSIDFLGVWFLAPNLQFHITTHLMQAIQSHFEIPKFRKYV